jgi:hypothetical protein
MGRLRGKIERRRERDERDRIAEAYYKWRKEEP